VGSPLHAGRVPLGGAYGVRALRELFVMPAIMMKLTNLIRDRRLRIRRTRRRRQTFWLDQLFHHREGGQNNANYNCNPVVLRS
jgi:hypothetical protein